MPLGVASDDGVVPWLGVVVVVGAPDGLGDEEITGEALPLLGVAPVGTLFEGLGEATLGVEEATLGVEETTGEAWPLLGVVVVVGTGDEEDVVGVGTEDGVAP